MDPVPSSSSEPFSKRFNPPPPAAGNVLESSATKHDDAGWTAKETRDFEVATNSSLVYSDLFFFSSTLGAGAHV